MRTKLVLALSLAALSTAAAPVCVRDCDCAPPRDLRVAAEAADVVFAGTSRGFRFEGDDTVRIRSSFRVVVVWKGDVPAEAVVWSPDVSDCAMAFARDDSYVVFATRDGAGRLITRQCVGTQLLSDAGDGLDALGSPRDPSPAADSATEAAP